MAGSKDKAQKEKFIKGMIALGKTRAQAESIWEMSQSGSGGGAASGNDAIAQQSPYYNTNIYMDRTQLDVVSEFNKLSQQLTDLQFKAQHGNTAAAIEAQSVQIKMRLLKKEMGAKKLSGYANQKYQDAILAPLQWDQATLKKFVNSGIMRGIDGFQPGMGMPEIMSKWQDMVASSAMLSQKGKKFSPWDVMATYGQSGKFGTITKDGWVFDVGTGERLKYVGPRTKKSVAKHVDLSSPEQAQALIKSTLQDLLGRNPTAQELSKFKSSVSGYEQAHPEVSSTTMTLPESEIQAAMKENRDVDWSAASSDTTTTGGVTDAARAQLVEGGITGTKEYGKVQGGTTLFNALMSMINGGG